MHNITPVILSGGAGTRLWPLSRQLNPKQFLKLFGDRTMLQQTMERLKGLPCTVPFIVCNEEHRFLAGEQLIESGINDFAIILEPVPRNTAPAIALAAIHAMGNDGNALLLVLPADHIIADTDVFRKAVLDAIPAAEEGKLVTFGVLPKHPETGYGYIQRGNEQGQNIFEVASFTEKPDQERAKEYTDSGEYYWNSGMFLFRAETYLEELDRHAPKVYEACTKAMQKTEKDLDFIRVEPEAFELSPSISIDYAVMEKTNLASVVPLDAGWSDMGSWTSLWEVSDKDQDGNSLSGDVKVMDTKDSLVRAENRFVATVGINDLVVVETKDAVLVAHKDQVQKVKDLVEEIRKNGRHEHLNQREVFRPWGSYDSLETGERFQVKRIRVKPGAGLSLQMHHHRAEHWIVVKGSAKVAIDGETIFLTENESTFIPVGKPHRLENPGKIPLELIEVQSGSYLGEDDIVRLEDRYGRKTRN